MFQKILVAVKFTHASRSALEKGADLARIHGASLHVFHCLDYQLTRLKDTHPERVAAQAAAHQRYDDEIQPLVADLRSVSFESLPGDPALSVCLTARQIGADLIILGCHQHGEKLSLGRVDYVGITILEKAHCPIMLVPLQEHGEG